MKEFEIILPQFDALHFVLFSKNILFGFKKFAILLFHPLCKYIILKICCKYKDLNPPQNAKLIDISKSSIIWTQLKSYLKDETWGFSGKIVFNAFITTWKFPHVNHILFCLIYFKKETNFTFYTFGSKKKQIFDFGLLVYKRTKFFMMCFWFKKQPKFSWYAFGSKRNEFSWYSFGSKRHKFTFYVFSSKNSQIYISCFWFKKIQIFNLSVLIFRKI